MSFPPVPNLSKNAINTAGRQLSSSNLKGKAYRDAVDIVNSWRVCHAYTINTFNATLRKKVARYQGAIVAQRLKRLPTIIDKLQRQPNMDLTRMQDIGGVRAILPELEQVQELRREYEDPGRFSHELYDVDDYIANPKKDGYRGVHLIYRYNNSLGRSGNPQQYKGLFVEVQLRTLLQHEWATAVETTGIMLNQHLKTQRGSTEWLEFFEYMSSVFAIIEDSPVLEKHKGLTTQQIINKAAAYIKNLHVVDTLLGWRHAARLITENRIGGHYNIIILDTSDKTIRIRGFSKDQLDKASTEYARVEQDAIINPNLDVVLVAAGGIKDLKKAYPNYFLDIRNFIGRLNDIVSTAD